MGRWDKLKATAIQVTEWRYVKEQLKKIATWQVMYIILSSVLFFIFSYWFSDRFFRFGQVLYVVAIFTCYIPLIYRGMRDRISSKIFSFAALLIFLNLISWVIALIYRSFVLIVPLY